MYLNDSISHNFPDSQSELLDGKRFGEKAEYIKMNFPLYQNRVIHLKSIKLN
jgi:hypothetical protein